MNKNGFYDNKSNKYFSSVRRDIIKFIPCGKNRVLEVGCGNGATLVKLKNENKADETVGIDIKSSDEILAEVDCYIRGDIEDIELDYPEKYFNIIICADVLEHLVDPWNTVKKLLKYLKDDGLFVVSIPNIKEISVLWSILIKGDFKYEECGILINRTFVSFAKIFLGYLAITTWRSFCQEEDIFNFQKFN